MSHDSGYDWEKFQLPQAVAEYIQNKNCIRNYPGSVHSHKSCDWRHVLCERSLKRRDEYVSEDCKRVVSIAETIKELVSQLRLNNRAEVLASIEQLAHSACVEMISDVAIQEAYRQLIQLQANFTRQLREQQEADRVKERDSFLTPSQWAGLGSLSLPH